MTYLDELRAEVVRAHEAHAAGTVRRRRRPPLLRPALAAAALAVLVAVFAVVVVRERPEPVAPRIVGELRIGGAPIDAVGFDGRVWVVDSAARRVVGIDPEGRRVTAGVASGGQPQFVDAAEDGGLWVHAGRSGTDDATVGRIDPDAGRVTARVAVGAEGPMAVGGGYVWAAAWAATDNRPREGLYRVDARTLRTLPRIPLTGVDDIAVGGGTVWALTSTGELARIDGASGRIEQRRPGASVASGVSAGARALAVDEDGLWLLSTPQFDEGTLTRYAGDRIERTLPLAPSALPVLAVTSAGLWTAHGDDLRDRYRLTRIDPATGRVTATVALGGRRPVALVPLGGELWVIGDDGVAAIVR
jgi:DNA-binding beta-propeller fold protein YncE